VPVVTWIATEAPGVIAVARFDIGLPPVVIPIAAVRAVAASTAGAVDVPLVVA
jgi:hypothetical protein